jgi:hypothetical protein
VSTRVVLVPRCAWWRFELIEADPYQQAHPRPYRLLVWGKALPQYEVLM